MKDAYVAALVEDMNGKFDLIMETLKPIQADVAQLTYDVAILKDESKLWRALYKDHECRITVLEKAV